MNILYIDKEVHLSIKNNQILIKKDKKEIIIPTNEVKTIFIDNFFSFSKKFLEVCNKNNISLIIADEKHYPNIILLNLNNPFFKMYENIKLQIDLDENNKLLAWKTILSIKILNSMSLINKFNIDIFRKINKNNNKFKLLQIEGNFANNYYNDVFGKEFKRKTKYYIDDNILNSFLNYGYSILRTKIIHYLTINGLLPYFSLFHSPNNNNFALADDLIEPYRFIIDYLAISNKEKLEYGRSFDKKLKKIILDVLNIKVKVKNKGYYILNDAIQLAIKDYKQFLITKDLKFLKTFKITLY
jgi:CRISPR-associated protein Cas1